MPSFTDTEYKYKHTNRHTHTTHGQNTNGEKKKRKQLNSIQVVIKRISSVFLGWPFLWNCGEIKIPFCLRNYSTTVYGHTHTQTRARTAAPYSNDAAHLFFTLPYRTVSHRTIKRTSSHFRIDSITIKSAFTIMMGWWMLFLLTFSLSLAPFNFSILCCQSLGCRHMAATSVYECDRVPIIAVLSRRRQQH